MLIEWSDLVEYPGVLLVLSLTFVVYFFRGCCVGIYLGEYYRLVDILVHNPNCYLEIVRDALLFLVLPSAVGLAFTVVAFVRERRKSSNQLRGVSCLPLMAVGGFLFWWGVHGVWWNYNHYLYAIDDATYWGVDLAEPLLKIYATAADILWLVAGLLLMLSPVFKMVREKVAPTTN